MSEVLGRILVQWNLHETKTKHKHTYTLRQVYKQQLNRDSHSLTHTRLKVKIF